MITNIGLMLLLPLAAVILMPWVSRLHRRAADVLAALAGLGLVGLCLRFIPLHGETLTLRALNTQFSVDGLSLLFLVVVNVVGFFCILYSIDYMNHYDGRGKFYALLLLMMLGLNGVLLVRDLFSLYVYLEIVSIASYVLVAFSLKWDGIESALKYLLLSVVATGLILVGLGIMYLNLGTLEFAELKLLLAAGSGPNTVFLLAAALFIAGFGLKAAIMPFHAWLPDAHPSAPAPISAMLSGVVIKVAGVYALTRLFFDIYPSPARILNVFLILGVVSMIGGALIAYFQSDIKRMFAYSSISQIGYILIGLGLGNPLGLIGALFHVLNHALFKSLLFLNSGALQYRTHTRDMNEMGGLEHRMRVTGITSIFGTLSIAGVPPFNGFWSKLFIILGALAAKQYVVAVLAIFLSVFTLGYFLLMQRRVFFGKLNLKWQDLKEVPLTMSLAMIFLAAQCLLVGIFFNEVLRYLVEPAAAILLGGK